VNNELALSWLTRAAELGSTEHMFRLGRWYGTGQCCDSVDHERALFWYRKSTDDEESKGEAESALGYHHRAIDNVLALRWYMKGALRNHIPCVLAVAKFYSDGNGVENSDENMAFQWKLRAAKLGDKEAIYEVAQAYDMGRN
jgi:TPR repeat protein